MREHKSTLSELSIEEWAEFAEISRLLEKAVTKSFSPTHFNWICLMNGAFQANQSAHVHWHMIPRYNIAVEFDGNTYVDPSWPGKYEHKNPKLLTRTELEAIKNTLTGNMYAPEQLKDAVIPIGS